MTVLGKDRTGLVIALLLAALGISLDQIFENYHMSDLYLDAIQPEIVEDNRNKGLDLHFDFCPKQVMEVTFGLILS